MQQILHKIRSLVRSDKNAERHTSLSIKWPTDDIALTSVCLSCQWHTLQTHTETQTHAHAQQRNGPYTCTFVQWKMTGQSFGSTFSRALLPFLCTHVHVTCPYTCHNKLCIALTCPLTHVRVYVCMYVCMYRRARARHVPVHGYVTCMGTCTCTSRVIINYTLH